MANAKQELLNILEMRNGRIKCAEVYTDDLAKRWVAKGEWGIIEEPGVEDMKAILKVGYTEEEYNKFLNGLDFEYDNGYGHQILHGTIWMDDNTWVDRGEYDGSEWWKWNFLPDIPEHLKEDLQVGPKK
jgi:hypothetical protein